MNGNIERGDPIVHTKILFHWTMKKGKSYAPSDYKALLENIFKVGLRFGEIEEKFRLRGNVLQRCYASPKQECRTRLQGNRTISHGDMAIWV